MSDGMMVAERIPPAAKRLARHRETFELAIAEGLSLDEARDRLSRRRWLATMERLDARRSDITKSRPESRPLPDQPWMMRD